MASPLSGAFTLSSKSTNYCSSQRSAPILRFDGFLRGFLAAAVERRRQLSNGLSWEDNGSTLIRFSQRSAVFALRGNCTQ